LVALAFFASSIGNSFILKAARSDASTRFCVSAVL
jgi:hypothetical protein